MPRKRAAGRRKNEGGLFAKKPGGNKGNSFLARVGRSATTEKSGAREKTRKKGAPKGFSIFGKLVGK